MGSILGSNRHHTLNSRTRETSWAIGSCLGAVIDVDVIEAEEQWGKCLRVRV